MNKTTPYQDDLNSGRTINVNGTPMSIATYNLLISKRDLGLWAVGMKPHRNWYVSDVKKYFGLTGHNRDKLVTQLKQLEQND